MPPRSEPRVDVIVAVHNSSRPVERAVASTLRNAVGVRVSVVAHNVQAASIRTRLGSLAADPRVRVLELADGVRSPANAYNHGLDMSTAEFVSIVGSDDELDAGALDEWLALAERLDADAVIAPIVRDGGGGVPTPRVRRRRIGQIADLDRDRLFERSAPLGLQRRARVDHLRYSAGLPRGVDQAYGLRLWNDHRVVFDPRLPAYLEHADQDDRITHVFGALADDFVWIEDLADALERVSPAVRRGVVAKTLRVHLLPGVGVRARAGSLDSEDRAVAAHLLQRFIDLAPSAPGLLPRSLRAEMRAITAGEVPPIADAGGVRRLSDLLPIDLRSTLHRHAPLRSQLAGRGVAVATARAARHRLEARRLEEARPDGSSSDSDSVVVLAPHGSAIADRLRSEHSATVIGWSGSGATIEIPRRGHLALWMWGALGSSFPGRLVARVLGVDESARFAAATRRDAAAMAALTCAHLVVAADEDAILAAWRSGRRGRGRTVVYGSAAADQAIADRTDIR